MKIDRPIALFCAAFIAAASIFCFSACGGEDSEQREALCGEIVGISKYGNVYLNLTKEEIAEYGVEYGDTVTVTFPGTETVVPYCSNYSDVDAGASGLFGKEDESFVALAVNVGSFASVYGIADKVTNEDKSYEWVYRDGAESFSFTITLKEKRGYYSEYVVRQLSYTDDREDYPDLTDEQFCNFRAIATTGIKENVLYRSASPVDPQRNRNTYADAAARRHGVSVIVDLADSEETLKSFDGFEESYFATTEYVALDMGVDQTEADYRVKLKAGLSFMAENEGVYLVHCLEGKDRAGFVSALLEFFVGASYDEAEDDYMTSYYNYYGVRKGDDKYGIIATSNFEKMLLRAFGVSEIKNADLKLLARNYMSELGLSEGEIAALEKNLAKE